MDPRELLQLEHVEMVTMAMSAKPANQGMVGAMMAPIAITVRTAPTSIFKYLVLLYWQRLLLLLDLDLLFRL